jgi:chorismate mutase
MYRNLPQWHIPIELKRRIPNIPLISDPSHIGGKRELIAPLSQQAMDLNYDGLMIESHCDPDNAWSDKEQQLTPDVLSYILNMLIIRETKQTTENLTELRRQIDEIDNDLLSVLARRMRVSREIGQYKKEHNMPVLQTVRYDEILGNRTANAEKMGMGADFMRTVLEAIHEESIREQIVIIHQ